MTFQQKQTTLQPMETDIEPGPLPFQEHCTTALPFITVPDEDNAYALQVAPNCDSAMLPQGIENLDGKRVIEIPVFESMTHYLMSKEGADKRLTLYSFLNDLLRRGRLSGIVGFPVLNRIINRQACDFTDFRYWELDRQEFIADISVTLTLKSKEGVREWKGVLVCYCGFTHQFYLTVEELVKSTDRVSEGYIPLDNHLIQIYKGYQIDQETELMWSRYRLSEALNDGKVTMPYGRFLGYRKGEDGLPEIVPEEAEVVRMIYRSFMDGLSYYKIAQLLMKRSIPAPSGGEKWHRRTVESILTNEKYKGSALLQKKFTVDFLTKKQKVNEGEVPQYFIEDSHPPIIDPQEFELVQAEIARRKEIGKVYSNSNIFSTKLVCSCCGGFFGSKVWHSTSKYRRVIWQCNHKFQNGEKCKTPHLYEDEIKKRFIEVCNRIASDKEDFLISCQQIVEMLSDTAAIDRKIEEQYIYLNGLTASMQQFIRENAMQPQGEDFYDTKLAEYEKQCAEGETRLKDLQSQKAARLSRKELLDGLVKALEESGILIDKFDERLWRLMVEKATVDTDGKLTFTLRNGMEIEV